MAPDAGEGWGGLSAGHVVSRSVRDSALMLDCTAGPEPGDPYAAPPQERSFLEAITRPPRKLRIALMLKDHRGVELHPECLEAVQSAAKLCASLGHVVEEADPELDMVALRPMNARISATNTARSCNMRWKVVGREPNADDVEAVTWAVYQRGLKVSGVEYVEAIAAVHAAGRKMATFLTSYDVILSTTLPCSRWLAVAKQFVADSLLEEAVRSELVSGRPKFPVSREFTGNFIDFGLGCPYLSSKRLL